MKIFVLLGLAVPSLALSAENYSAEDSWTVETISLPEGVPPEVGAVQFDSQGTLYVALRRNDIITAKPTADPDQFDWKHFASGFHNACGMEVVAPGHIVVSQMPELTDVRDIDGDGKADTYRVLADEWGVSGNYHETNEICPDGEGGYYIAVGTASQNGPTLQHVRGAYSKIGRRGRNFSSVQWKGWVLRYHPNGEVTPFASGFRMHNGIMRNSRGELWCTDNQGDWKATTPLYHVQKNRFYGHPSSLVWDPKWPEGKDPLKMSLDEIDEMRTPAAVLIPHQEMNRSAAEPVEIPEGFGPYTGQILIPDNNGSRITRVMLDRVNGQYQGSCTHFINGKGLLSGGNRAVFTADGTTLYTGHTVRGWGKLAEGLQRTIWTGVVPFDVKMISLQKDGFDLDFTLPISSFDPKNCELRSFRYQSDWSYGGPKLDQRKELAAATKTGEASIFIQVEDLEPKRVYQLTLKELKDNEGKPLSNEVFYYTLNTLRQD